MHDAFIPWCTVAGLPPVNLVVAGLGLSLSCSVIGSDACCEIVPLGYVVLLVHSPADFGLRIIEWEVLTAVCRHLPPVINPDVQVPT